MHLEKNLKALMFIIIMKLFILIYSLLTYDNLDATHASVQFE